MAYQGKFLNTNDRKPASTPVRKVPRAAVSQETMPLHTATQEPLSQETARWEIPVQEIAAQAVTFQDTVPQKTVPQKTVPQKTVPQKSTPKVRFSPAVLVFTVLAACTSLAASGLFLFMLL